MSKRFITLKDVEEQISNGKIYLDEKAILSSSLQDYIREHNIQVVYGEEETCSVKPSVEDCACLKEEVNNTKSKADDFAEVARMVVKILKNDYGIQDEAKIMQVIKIIRASENVGIARQSLMERFELSEAQAFAIVDMRLRALTGLEREKLESEYAELIEKIKYYNEILADNNKLLALIKEEISIVSEKYSTDRKTIFGHDESMEDEDLIADEDTVVVMTNLGYIKRMSPDNFKSQNRGGKGIKGMQTIEDDFIEDIIITSTHKNIYFFTNMGRVYKIKAYKIPDASRIARGNAASLSSLLNYL